MILSLLLQVVVVVKPLFFSVFLVQAFSIVSETKQEDLRKSKLLEEYYTAADEILDRDQIIFDHVEKNIGNVKETIKQQIRQMKLLSQEGCYLLVAGK